MEKNNIVRYALLFIAVGILVGLVLSAGLNWTALSGARSTPVANDNPSQPPVTSNDTSGISVVEQISNAFANVAQQVNPSVVTISTEKIIKSRGLPFQQFPFEEFFGEDFRRFFQNQQPNREQKQYGLGSGVIVSDDGIILTNNHVVQAADNITIRLLDGSEFKGEVKGTDARTDLAVVKIDAKNLHYLKFGDSDKARVGEWVLAIGSPLSENLAHTVTSGIISAKGRSGLFNSEQYEDFIQTDAAINPGNSGGAMVNLRGELIGINSAIATRTGGFMGIGFAIPSNLAHKVMNDILERGKVVRGWLGVYIQDVNPNLAKALGLTKPSGVLISGVQDGSPADKAGLKAEDVIIKLDGKQVTNSSELRTRIASESPNTKVKLTIFRNGDEKEVEVKLGELEENQTASGETNKTIEKVGIEVANISPEMVKKFDLKVKDHGVVIVRVDQGSLAAQSGFRPGDVILKIDRKDVENLNDYNRLMKDVRPGDSLLFYIQRGKGNIFIAFTIPQD